MQEIEAVSGWHVAAGPPRLAGSGTGKVSDSALLTLEPQPDQGALGWRSEPSRLLAAAVLIDATIVRGVVLPAALTLLGERAWYLPSWLSWLPGRGLACEGGRSPRISLPAPEPVPVLLSGRQVSSG